MSYPYCYLTTSSGLEFRLSYSRSDLFMLLFNLGSLTIGSKSIHHVISGDGFTLYFDQAVLDFDISEISKFEDFLHQVTAAKAAA